MFLGVNLGTIYLSANPIFHARTNHIEIEYHFVREKVASKELEIWFVHSKYKFAYGFIKTLHARSLEEFKLNHNLIKL